MAPDLASPHDLGSKGRQGGAANVLRSDPKLMASPCIPLQHPHSSPSLSDCFCTEWTSPGSQLGHFVPRALAGLCSAHASLCQSPRCVPQPLSHHGMFASCLRAGSAVVSPAWVGDGTNTGSTRRAAELAPSACPPTAGGEPQPGDCPGLDTRWKREPRKSPVKAVFEFLAWQQLL